MLWTTWIRSLHEVVCDEWIDLHIKLWQETQEQYTVSKHL